MRSCWRMKSKSWDAAMNPQSPVHVAADTLSTAAETANLASELQADLGINSVSIVEL